MIMHSHITLPACYSDLCRILYNSIVRLKSWTMQHSGVLFKYTNYCNAVRTQCTSTIHRHLQQYVLECTRTVIRQLQQFVFKCTHSLSVLAQHTSTSLVPGSWQCDISSPWGRDTVYNQASLPRSLPPEWCSRVCRSARVPSDSTTRPPVARSPTYLHTEQHARHIIIHIDL